MKKRLFNIIFIISIVLYGFSSYSVYATNGMQSANVKITSISNNAFYSTTKDVPIHYIVNDAYNDSEFGNGKRPISSAIWIEVYRWSGTSWTSVKDVFMGYIKNNDQALMGCENVNNFPGCTNFYLNKMQLTSGTYNAISKTGTYKVNLVAKPYYSDDNSDVPKSVIAESRYAMKTVYFNIYSSSYYINYSTTSGTKYVGDTFKPTLNNSNSLAVTYSSSNSSVASVDSSGNITCKGVGTATITAKLTYSSSTVSTTYKVTVKKGDPYASFASSSVSKKVGDAAFTNKLTYKGDGKVTYKSSKTSVATIDSNGKVTIKGAGTTTITATISSTTNWLDDSATYTLTVTSSGKKGDINSDNKIDLTDILLELKIYFKSMTPTTAQKSSADMNGDSKIDLTDVLLLLKAYFK